MFPIIPLHLRLSVDAYPSSKVPHFLATVPPPATGVDLVPCRTSSGVAAWESPSQVLAGEVIRCDVVSEEFAADNLLMERHCNAKTHHVTLTKGGRLSGLSWARHLRLSADCHTCNVLLQRGVDDTSKLRLQVIRPLRVGDELQLWFAQPTLTALSVPFLRPANIQGDNRYLCHLCSKTFETPNPLKVHLALWCQPIDKNHLYSRLLGSKTFVKPDQDKTKTSASNITLNQGKPGQVGAIPGLNLKQDPSPGLSVKQDQDCTLNIPYIPTRIKTERLPLNIKREPVDLLPELVNRPRSNTSPSHLVSVHSLLLPTSRLDGDNVFRFELPAKVRGSAATGSAFKPYWKPREGGEVDCRSTDERTQVGSFHPGGNNVYFEQAREMETLVSNLGRSKHGHLCVYCGKVYSRKYGLKIHIRTHTGFKPLQCRHCLRPFGDPSNLNKHVRLHAEGSTPYKCDLCGKILVRRRDLERHIKSRHSIDAADGIGS